MLGSYVCSRCRIHLLQSSLRQRRYPQWHSRATFLSFRDQNSKTSSGNSQNPAEPPPPQNAPSSSEVKSPNQQRAEYGTIPEWQGGDSESALLRNIPQGAGRYSRYTQSATTQDDVKQSENPNYAQEVLGEETESSTSLNIRRVQTGRNWALAIQNALDAKKTNRAWAVFLECSEERSSQGNTYPSLDNVALLNDEVFENILNAAIRDVQIFQQPSIQPSMILLKYEQLGKCPLHFWSSTIERLSRCLLSDLAAKGWNLQLVETVLTELLAVWRLLFQCKGITPALQQNLEENWGWLLPSHDRAKISEELQKPEQFAERLRRYIPGLQLTDQIMAKLSLSAVLLFNIFTDRNKAAHEIPISLRSQSEPFVRFLAQILPRSNMSWIFYEAKATIMAIPLPKKFGQDLLGQINATPSKALIISGVEDFLDSQSLVSNKLQEFFLTRIARAVENQHLGRLQSLWNETLKAYSAEGKSGQSSIPSPIYCALLTAFLGMSRPDQAVTIWNHMVENGNQPGVREWTAMLDGCKKRRDTEGMELMWRRMLQAGVKPDNYAWTTRVHGLIAGRKVNEGFAALDEMGRLWQAGEDAANPIANKGRKTKASLKHSPAANPYIKPSIEVVDAAITTISRLPVRTMDEHRKRENIEKVVQWGVRFDLEPSIRTFNILIDAALRTSNNSQAFQLLNQMEKAGLQPDEATFSMLTHASLNSDKFSQLSPEGQVKQSLALFEELERRGLELNGYHYATTAEQLLQNYKNYSAVHMLVAHMTERQIVLPAAMYTSLVKAYFAEDPPNIAAVDGLWHHIATTPGAVTDRILFDRLIEGYASVGEIGQMMTILARSGEHAKQPSWYTLSSVMRALVKAGEVDRAKAVAREVHHQNVQMGKGLAGQGIRGGNRARNEFWKMVQELGIWKDEMVEPGQNQMNQETEEMQSMYAAERDIKSSDKDVEAVEEESDELAWKDDSIIVEREADVEKRNSSVEI